MASGIKMGDDGDGSLISPDGVAPRQMVSVSASVIFPCTMKSRRFSSGTGSPGWSRKKGHETVVYVCVCLLIQFSIGIGELCKGSNVAFVSSVVNEERMRPGHHC